MPKINVNVSATTLLGSVLLVLLVCSISYGLSLEARKHPMSAVCFTVGGGGHKPVHYESDDTIYLDHTGWWTRDGKIRYFPGFAEGCILKDGKLPSGDSGAGGTSGPSEPEEPQSHSIKPPKLEDWQLLQPDPDHGQRDVQSII